MTVLQAAEQPAAPNRSASPAGTPAEASTNIIPHFTVQNYVIKYNVLIFTNAPVPNLSEYTGTNISLERIAQAASEVLSEFERRGYPRANISIAQDQITDGVVTMNIFQGAVPQVLISGKVYPVAGGGGGVVISSQAVSEPTNALPHIALVGYQVEGNTLLSDETLQAIFSKYVGTNLTFADIGNAVKELQLEYHDRGFDTVHVTIPQQSITNAILKVVAIEGTLAEIRVIGNRYYSSNNVMRALPGLKTNMILNSRVFQAELNRANANQDRQIYPQIAPGPGTNTTDLDLVVKDRLPLHGKLELNNQSSPGTPDLRVNSSAVYNNLWQEDHSLGVQYSFAPSNYKMGSQWAFYDRPLVANYSGFYRLPLGNPTSVAEEVESRPGSFGFNEATRKFELPPASGLPELNIFASRSTIDTGLNQSTPDILLQTTARTITSSTSQQDLTVNEDLGFRLSEPLPEVGGLRSTVSAGLDFKTYHVQSDKSFNYEFIEILHHTPGDAGFQQVGFLNSPVPTSTQFLQYMPLSFRWDANRADGLGSWNFGFSYSPNVWFSGGATNVQAISGSTHSSGFWHVLGASAGREQVLYGDWRLAVRADGQWSSEPLISNEQFGDGGVNGVRGYREGEVFGDTGWRVTSELKTPVHTVGLINGTERVTIRGSIFMDYAETYLLDPNGRSPKTPLWGTGVGMVSSVGSHGEVRLLFGWPLLDSPSSEAGQLRLSFGVNAQF